MLTQIEGAFAEKSASEERLRQFVADASHELRTPLTSIRGYAELLRRGGFSDEAGTAGPSSGSRTRRRAWAAWSRTSSCWPSWTGAGRSGRSRWTSTASAPTWWRTPTRPTRHDLTLTPGRAVVVLGDAERLTQVAHNLVRNALAHTPPGTRSGCRRAANEAWAYIRVTDNGPGIEPAVARRSSIASTRATRSAGPGHRAGAGHRARHRRSPARDGEVAASPEGGARCGSGSRWRRPRGARPRPPAPNPSSQVHRAFGYPGRRDRVSLTWPRPPRLRVGVGHDARPGLQREVAPSASSRALRMPIIDSPLPSALTQPTGHRDRAPGSRGRNGGQRLARGVPPTAGRRMYRSTDEHADGPLPSLPRSGYPGGPPNGRRPARARPAPTARRRAGAGGSEVLDHVAVLRPVLGRAGQAALGVGVGRAVSPRATVPARGWHDDRRRPGHEQLGGGAEEGAVGDGHGEDGAVGSSARSRRRTADRGSGR